MELALFFAVHPKRYIHLVHLENLSEIVQRAISDGNNTI